MKPVRNARRVLKRSSNLRLTEMTVGLTFLSLASDLLGAFKDSLPGAPFWLVGAASITGTLAWVARLVAQESISGDDNADQ